MIVNKIVFLIFIIINKMYTYLKQLKFMFNVPKLQLGRTIN